MKKALVVNCSLEMTASNRSREFYNLGAAKLANYLESIGYDVTRCAGDPGMYVVGYDLVCVSAIFSWHTPLAVEIAKRAKEYGSEVWAGGPGTHGVRAWFEEQTGVVPVWRPDPRFDRQPGDYRMIYAVRGCEGESVDNGPPVPCPWCNVPKVEGTLYILNPAFEPTPMLLDNNLSGMPVRMQEHVIARYLECNVALLDANSGFEPGRFDAGTRARWEKILRGPWRWGFDQIGEEAHVREMARLLRDYVGRRKRVYAMCGNEPIATCYERAQKVIELGAEPHVQFEIPLGARDRYDVALWPVTQQPKFDWTVSLGRDFSRFYNSMLWRTMTLADYKPRVHEKAPFADLRGIA